MWNKTKDYWTTVLLCLPRTLCVVSLFPLHFLLVFPPPTCNAFFSASSHFPHFFQPYIWLSVQLCDPSHQQLGQHWRELGPLQTIPGAGVCVCVLLCVFVCLCVCWCVQLATRLHTHARLALSAQSGFNWMIGTLLALTVSVIQTLSRSHRLQQASPLSIKANPLSPARLWWNSD